MSKQKYDTDAEHENDVLTIPQQLEMMFREKCQYYEMSPKDKNNGRLFDAVLMEINQELFRIGKNDKRVNMRACKIPYYETETILACAEIYLKYTNIYNVLPSLYSIETMFGISHQTLYNWHENNHSNTLVFRFNNQDLEQDKIQYIYINDISQVNTMPNTDNNATMQEIDRELTSWRVDLLKFVNEASTQAVRTRLYTSDVGAIALANNDRSIGLMYSSNAIPQNQTIVIASSDVARKYGIQDKKSQENTKK